MQHLAEKFVIHGAPQSEVHSQRLNINSGDLKPSNILIMWNGIAKITDFGLSYKINPTIYAQRNMIGYNPTLAGFRFGVLGTYVYEPPENLRGLLCVLSSRPWRY